MPSLKLLGHLKQPGDLKALFRWVKNHLFEKDPLIIAMDTIAYGGLIASRVNQEPYTVLEKRVDTFFEQIQVASCYAFSSILRIPNYNNDEEEPAYWKEYGAQLYDYSVNSHQSKSPALKHNIPQNILTDFLERRKKNLALNEYHLNLLRKGDIDYLTYGQDDTGDYGINVQEAEYLKTQIKRYKRSAVTQVKTGMDELACCMLSRWTVMQLPEQLYVYPVYSSEKGHQCLAKFDGLPIQSVVEQAIESCGASLAKNADSADLLLMVHTPKNHQGDHCEMPNYTPDPQVTDNLQHEQVITKMQDALTQGQPFALADVAYANGSDPELTEKLLMAFDDLTGLYGYAGWNTPGNSIGSALAMGLVRLAAVRKKSFFSEPFCKLLLTRFADDWLYQSVNRYRVKKINPAATALDEKLLNVVMADGLSLLKTKLGLEETQIHCRYPCQRYFEVELLFK